jgi:hypothetical protein
LLQHFALSTFFDTWYSAILDSINFYSNWNNNQKTVTLFKQSLKLVLTSAFKVQDSLKTGFIWNCHVALYFHNFQNHECKPCW